MKSFSRLVAVASALLCLQAFSSAQSGARVWEESLVLPTYLVEAPEPNPIFFSGRTYQGAKGPIYPYPILDRLSDTRTDKTYRAVYLENRFVKICVLPELGGRILSAVDKTDNYDFVYRQHVIKPALIGMLGAWISGGVEWNIPHHHRASTFMEVDHTLAQNPDGSVTAWVGEIELRHRMKWEIGMTLRPETSVLEITMRVFNRTPLAHSMLAWANVAIHANPDYQVIFPPDVEFATFHAKNQFSRWPVSTEVFNRQDYTKGVDVSWWKSHVTPTSFFAWNASGDFLAGYDHGKDAGVAFVADHTFVPGKKLWTWGTGKEGKLWEKILTETDGPYAELMVGAYSDNQPDYSWIQPYETRKVQQFWYPIRRIGGVKAANAEAACNLTVIEPGKARIGFQPTRDLGSVRVTLDASGRAIFEETLSSSPDGPYVRGIPLPGGIKEEDLGLKFVSASGREILSYRPPKRQAKPLPPVVTPPSAPKDIPTVEELYLTGLRAEQFYSPSVDPYPYYEEALKRDPGDYRVNTALALAYLKRAMYREAEEAARRAVDRATKNYTRPKDGEAFYYLGVALRAQDKLEEAEDFFGRAAWSVAWRSAGLSQLAEMASRRGDWEKALALADASLETNATNSKMLDLRSALLRRLGRPGEAEQTVTRALALDPLDLWAASEFSFLKSAAARGETAQRASENLEKLMRGSEQNDLELAADYGACGLWDEAIGVLDQAMRAAKNSGKYSPLLFYDRAYFRDRKGETGAAGDLAVASAAPFDYGFPFQAECIDVLRWAQGRNPKDGRAPYYLGNYLFDLQPEAALAEWTKSVALDGANSVALRNLGLATARVKGDVPAAITCYEKALAINPGDPKLYFELDQLYEADRAPAAKRLERLEKNQAVVEKRDDSLMREIMVLIQAEKYDRAIELLGKHHFHVWEGGGEIHFVFVDAYLERGQSFQEAKNYRRALADFEAALTYPLNLEVPEPSAGSGSAKIYFLIGAAQEALGDSAKARGAYEKAAAFKPSWSEQSYYQALAFRRLGREAEARNLVEGLIRFAQDRLGSAQGVQSAMRRGERQAASTQSAESHYLLGLGLFDQGKKSEAKREFAKALELNYALSGAARMMKVIG